MRPLARLTVIILAAMLVVPGSAIAQSPEASPAGSPPAAPVVAGCTVEPRTIEEIEAIAAEVEPRPVDALPLTFIDAIPDGTPADEATVDAITATFLMLVACLATQSPLTYTALYTDEFLRDIVSFDPQDTVEVFRTATAVADPAPIPEIGEVERVTVLDDGQVSAVVTILGVEDDHPTPGRTVLIVFAEEAGMWRVDGVYERITPGPEETEAGYVADAIGIEATPAATSGS